MDERFNFETPLTRRPQQMIDSEEYVIIDHEGTIPDEGGTTLHFSIPERPLLVDRRNFLRVTGIWESKLGTAEWEAAVPDTQKTLLINENFIAFVISAITVRKAYRVLNTECWLENCRALWETYVLQHKHPDDDQMFSMDHSDPARYCYPTTTQWQYDKDPYKAFSANIFKAGGFTCNYRPFHFLFGGSDPTHPSPQILPRLDEPLTLSVELCRNSHHLYITKDAGKLYRVRITDVKLVMAVPILSPYANHILSQKKLNNTVQYTGVQYPQRLLFCTGEAAKTLTIENIRLPDMVVMQCFKKGILLGRDTTAGHATNLLYRPVEHKVKSVTVLFGGKHFFMDRSMFDLDNPEMTLLRYDRFMQYPPFNSRVNPKCHSGMTDYSATAITLDFRSNPKTGEKMKPVLAEKSDSDVADLELKLQSTSTLTNVFLVTLVYKDTYINLNAASGSLWAPILEAR